MNPFRHLTRASKPLFAAKTGSQFSLGLRGELVAAGAGTLTMEVDRVRHYPGGTWLDIDARPVVLDVPEDALVAPALVGSASRSRSIRFARSGARVHDESEDDRRDASSARRAPFASPASPRCPSSTFRRKAAEARAQRERAKRREAPLGDAEMPAEQALELVRRPAMEVKLVAAPLDPVSEEPARRACRRMTLFTRRMSGSFGTVTTATPDGRSSRAIAASTASGSTTCSSTSVQTTRSKLSAGRSSLSTSPFTKRTS